MGIFGEPGLTLVHAHTHAAASAREQSRKNGFIFIVSAYFAFLCSGRHAALVLAALSCLAALAVCSFAAGLGLWNGSFRDSLALFLTETGGGLVALRAGRALALLLHFISLVYLAITASHMLPRFRFAAAFGLFCLISTLEGLPVNALQAAFDGRPAPLWALLLALSLAFTAVHVWLTGFLLKRTLNIE